jgi:PAS domain S-box-containing protein
MKIGHPVPPQDTHRDRSETQLPPLFEHLPLILIEDTGVIRDAALPFRKLFGNTGFQLEGRSIFTMIEASDASELHAALQYCGNTGDVTAIKVTIHPTPETATHLSLQIQPFAIGGHADHGKTERKEFLVHATDISLETRLQGQLEERNQALDTLHARTLRTGFMLRTIRKVNQIITGEQSVDVLIRQACESLCDDLGYQHAWIGCFSPDFTPEKASLTSFASAHSNPEFLDVETQLRLGQWNHCIHCALEREEAQIILRPLEDCGNCPLANLHSRHRGLVCRLQHRKRIYGVLSVAVPENTPCDAEEIKLFRELSNDLAFAINRIENEAQLRQTRSNLQRAQSLAQVGSWSLNLNTGTIRGSEETRRIHGLEGLEWDQSHFLQLCLPMFRPILEAQMRLLIHEGIPFEAEYQIRRSSDAKVCDLHAIAEYDPETGCVLGSVQDITERRLSEQHTRTREQFLQTMLETTSDGFWVINAQGRITEANTAYCNMTGHARADIIGKHIQDLDAVENENDTLRRMQRIRSKRTEVFETLHLTHDGTLLPVEVSATWMEQGEGCYVCFCRDLRGRKARDKRIALLGEMLDAAPASITIHDREGRFLFANRMTAAMHGFSGKKEFLALNLHDLDDPESATGIPERMDRIHQKGAARFEVRHRRFDGSTFPVEVLAKSIEWEGKSAVLSIASDITQRKQTEFALRHSEERMQSVFRSAPVGIGVVTNRIIQQVNQKLCQITGYQEEELLHHNARMLYSNDADYEWVGKEKYRQITINGTGTVETTWLRKDGSRIEVLLSSTPIDLTDLGKGVTFTALDITDRKRAEQSLRRSEREHRLLLQHLHAGVVVHAPDTRIVFVNQQAAELLGVDPNTALGISAMHPEWCFLDVEGNIMPVEDFPVVKVLHTQGPIRHLVVGIRRTRDSEPVWVLVNAFPETDEEGKLRQIVVTFVDITDRKLLEEKQSQMMLALLQEKEAAEAADRAKDEFLAVMSHEMRTPLNAILGFSNLLMEDMREPENREALQTVIDAGEHQLRLIDNILNYARLDRSSITPDCVAFNLMNLCQTAIQNLGPQAHGLNLMFENGFAEHDSIPSKMQAISDPGMLKRILENLLGNAVKYTRKGSIQLRIGIESKPSSDNKILHVEVEDSGIGIPEAHRQRLFQPFSQVDSSYKREFEGAGLGLAICRKLIELLEGKIGVESREGKGSKFWFSIPLTADIPQPVAARPKNLLIPKLLKPVCILVVDDRPDNAMVAEAFLKRMGAASQSALGAEAALSACRNNRFDAILMDLCMPDMDGFDLMKALILQGLPSETPIIAVTADASDECEQRCLEAGMKARITKPIRPEQLHAILNNI